MKNHYVDKLELSCKNCNGTMQIDSDNNVARCPYCDNTVILVENENVTIAKIELAQQEMEIAKLKLNLENNHEEQLNKTRKSFLTVLMLIFMAISVLAAAAGFATSHVVSALIALVQAALFSVAWLIRMRMIKGVERRIHTLVTIVALMCIVPFIACMDFEYRSYTKYTWPGSGLSEVIPQPKSQLGEIRSDNNTTFSMLIGKTTIEEFDAYVEECKKHGFTYEQNRYSGSFNAYNEDVTYLSLSYIERSKEFYLDVRALPEMKEYYWNAKGIAGKLPKPRSDLGFIKSEAATYFEILIAQVDKATYFDYVAECVDAGFDIDIIDYDEYFSAKNSDGYQLSVKREYKDILNISLYLIE